MSDLVEPSGFSLLCSVSLLISDFFISFCFYIRCWGFPRAVTGCLSGLRGEFDF